MPRGSDPRERMWAVEAGADRGVIGAAHEPPRVLVRADETPPGERLVGDADTVFGGEIAQPAQLLDDELVIVESRRGDIAAQQHRVDAQAAHEFELRAGPPQVLLQQILGHPFEVAERLVEVQGEAELGGQITDLFGGVRRDDEVGLEALRRHDVGDRSEPGAGDEHLRDREQEDRDRDVGRVPRRDLADEGEERARLDRGFVGEDL